jgi:hypothetical protein
MREVILITTRGKVIERIQENHRANEEMLQSFVGTTRNAPLPRVSSTRGKKSSRLQASVLGVAEASCRDSANHCDNGESTRTFNPSIPSTIRAPGETRQGSDRVGKEGFKMGCLGRRPSSRNSLVQTPRAPRQSSARQDETIPSRRASYLANRDEKPLGEHSTRNKPKQESCKRALTSLSRIAGKQPTIIKPIQSDTQENIPRGAAHSQLDDKWTTENDNEWNYRRTSRKHRQSDNNERAQAEKNELDYNLYSVLEAYLQAGDIGSHELQHAEAQMMQHLNSSYQRYKQS